MKIKMKAGLTGSGMGEPTGTRPPGAPWTTAFDQKWPPILQFAPPAMSTPAIDMTAYAIRRSLVMQRTVLPESHTSLVSIGE